MIRSIGMARIVAVVALAGVALPISALPSLALPITPNTSIVAYRPPTSTTPGLAIVGTLSDGRYALKSSFRTGRWSDIAVGRDTMALYDRKTGRLTTGRFRNGTWTPVRTRTIRAGYTHVVASCDTILFYERSTGLASTARLAAGDMGARRSLGLRSGLDLMDASCDTLYAFARGDSEWYQEWGLLADGRYARTSSRDRQQRPVTVFTANTSEWLAVDTTTAAPQWGAHGHMSSGAVDFLTDYGEMAYGAWDVFAAAADSAIFYAPRYGTAYTIRLENDSRTDVGPVAGGLPVGLKRVDGGK
jgi:hypothetical protein